MSRESEVTEIPQDLETLRMTEAFTKAMKARNQELSIKMTEAKSRSMATFVICIIIMAVGWACLSDYMSRRDAELQQQMMHEINPTYYPAPINH